MTNTLPRVVVADDHPTFRLGVRVWLEREGLRVVDEVGTVEELRAMMEATVVNAVVLDVALPDGDGIDAIPSLRAHAPDAIFVVVTSHDDAFTAHRALQAGAASFLPKDVDPSHIARSVRRFLSTSERGPEAGHHAPISLAPRELQVLSLVATGASNPAIARALGLSPETVKTYLQSAFGKLNVSDRTAAAIRARELNLIPRP